MKNLQSRIIRLPLVVGGPRSGWSHTRFPSGIGNGGGGWEPPPPPPPPPPTGSIAWQPFTSSAFYPWEATAPPGFTQIPTPHPDARVIHLDLPTSQGGLGNDANSGLSPSQPKATALAAVNMTRLGYGDRICVHRLQPEHNQWYAHDFRSPSQIRTNFQCGSPGNRVMITWYGSSGKRPRCRPLANFGSRAHHSHAAFVGIHWVWPEGEIGGGLWENADRSVLEHYNGGTGDFLLEDCELTNVEFIPQVQGHEGTKEDFWVRRNIFHYAYHKNSTTGQNPRPSNIYSRHIRNLVIEQNIFDYGGWYPGIAGANQFNHCLYIAEHNPHQGPDVYHNIISRPAGNGWQLRSGGRAIGNVVNYASVGGGIGNTGMTWQEWRHAITQNNLILRTHGQYRMANSCQNGVCTLARWGLSYNVRSSDGGPWISENNVIAETSNIWESEYGPLPGNYGTWMESFSHIIPGQSGTVNYPYPQEGRELDVQNNKYWRFNSSTQNDGVFVDPGRNIENYIDYIADDGGNRTFDQAMMHLRGRDTPYAWNEALNPVNINAWLLAGYDYL